VTLVPMIRRMCWKSLDWILTSPAMVNCWEGTGAREGGGQQTKGDGRAMARLDSQSLSRRKEWLEQSQSSIYSQLQKEGARHSSAEIAHVKIAGVPRPFPVPRSYYG